MNRHYAKAEVPQKTRVIGFRITDHEHQKIIEAQKALRSLGISGTTFEVADMLKVSKRTIEGHLYDKRDLPYLKIDRKVRITKSDLESFLSENRDLWKIWNRI